MSLSGCTPRAFNSQAKSNQNTAPASSSASQAFYKNLVSGATLDVGSTFDEVVEFDKTQDACDRHFARLNAQGKIKPESAASAVAQKDFLLCGKHIFFHFPFPTELGIPTSLLKSIFELYPDDVGVAFTKLGLHENPREPGMPLELPVTSAAKRSIKSAMTGEARVMTCATCHVGKLPTGQFAIGAPNEDLDLGKINSFLLYPLWLADRPGNKKDPNRWLPELSAFYKGLFEKSREKFTTSRIITDSAAFLSHLSAGGLIFALVGQDPPPVVDQRGFTKGLRGIYNPATPMLSDGRYELYSTPPSIWGMSHREENGAQSALKNQEAYLGTVTSAHSLESFARQAMIYTSMNADNLQDRYIDALVAYMRSLKPVGAPGVANSAAWAAGQKIFTTQCATCHDGYNGASTKYINLAEVSAPLVYQKFLVDFTPPYRQTKMILKELEKTAPIELEHKKAGTKARRMTGLWARSKLGTNGMVEGLDGLFCLNGKVRKNTDASDPLSDAMHSEICTQYSVNERTELKEFLTFFPAQDDSKR